MVRDHPDGRRPGRSLHGGHLHDAAMLEGLPEAEDLEDREGHGVVAVGEDLLRPDRVDPMAQGRERQDELVRGESGLDPRDVERGRPLTTRRFEARRMDEPGHRGRHDVDSGGQHLAEVVDALAGA